MAKGRDTKASPCEHGSYRENVALRPYHIGEKTCNNPPTRVYCRVLADARSAPPPNS